MEAQNGRCDMVAKNATTSLWKQLKDTWQTPCVKMYRLEAFVLLVSMLLGSALILRTLRWRTALPFVPFVLRAVYYLSSHGLSYIMGLLNDSPDRTGIIVMWAVFLVIFYESAESSGSEGLDDNEARRKRFLWDNVIPFFWFLALILFTVPAQRFWIPILLLWILLILKLREKKLALISACRSPGGQLDRVAKVVSDFMRYEHTQSGTPAGEPAELDPARMRGYKYLVGVKEAAEQVNSVNPPHHERQLDLNDIATIDVIWQCDGDLLSSSDKDNILKDTCLSFALFWLLLRRFAGYKLWELEHEESRRKTWMFVRDGLINNEDGNKCVERAFRVIEAELDFLHDFFYNSYYAAYSRGGFKFLMVRWVLVALYAVVSFVSLRKYNEMERKSMLWYDPNNVGIYVTRSVILVLAVVEVAQILIMITSKWAKVKWICKYVQKERTQTRLGMFERWAGYLLCQLPCIRRPWLKSWRRNLRQYSLLDSFGHTPLMSYFKCMEGHMDLPMNGQKKGDATNLSMDIKMAVIESLRRTNGANLSINVMSLCGNNGEESLMWKRNESDTNTHDILVWHIATSICEMGQNSRPLKDDVKKNLEVAVSLSKYCAYLVAFAPDLLPDHVYETRCCFEQVVSDSKKTLINCDSKEAKYEKLMNLGQQGTSDTILEKGALLGKKLFEKIEDEGTRWKILAEFWAKMILFLAPSENPEVHAKYLVTGGEFITHLWALLTHAGIVYRQSSDGTVLGPLQMEPGSVGCEDAV